MIYRHKIVHGSENVLILYFDYNYEFGIDFNNMNKNSSMKKEIINYIKKIKFDGEKVALAFGGVILALLMVVRNPNTDNYNLVYVNSSISPKVEYVLAEPTISSEVKEISTETVEKEKRTTKKVVDKQKKEVKKEESNKNIVTIYRKNGQVVNLDFDEYLIGVVGAEMPASFNEEALKAQAVIARTYALKKISEGVKLTDTVSTQSYLDNDELKEKWKDKYDFYYSKIKKCVYETKDLAIYYDNSLIDAVYHSTSNGKTEDSLYVWGYSKPYLKSVDSSFDINQSSYLRTITKDLDEVLDIFGDSYFDYEIISHDESGRVLEIRVNDKVYSGVEFRNILGLRSSDFDIEVIDNTINITTRGYGHGVGLSQYGANYLANNGYDFKEIIKYYYSNVNIK